MGSFIRVNVYYENLGELLEHAGVPVFGAVMNGENIFAQSKINEGIIVIGNEAKGIRNDILPFMHHPVTIPRKGKAESLNAAVAAAIILSHLSY